MIQQLPHTQKTKINEKRISRHLRLVKANFSLLGQELLRGRAITEIWMSSLISPKLGNFLDFGQVCGLINKCLLRSNQI